jgi:hypothetical protein
VNTIGICLHVVELFAGPFAEGQFVESVLVVAA